MKKIFLLILSFLIVVPVKAIEVVPSNIYYLDNGLNAYLEEIEFGELEENSKIFVEYRITKDDQTKTIDLIGIGVLPAKNLILAEDDEFYSEDLEIESRFVISATEYDYSEWSEKDKIATFNFDNAPTPKISSLDSGLRLNNEDEIKDYFDKYIRLNNLKLIEKYEYKINDSDWVSDQKQVRYDPNDVKIETRFKYEIGEYESKYSNILIYEKHPEKVCPFDSDICCQNLVGLSICYWIGIAFITITIVLIIIDRKKRISREA